MKPFDKINAQNILISFLIGFTSKDGDGISSERALELGRKLQVRPDGKHPNSKIENKVIRCTEKK